MCVSNALDGTGNHFIGVDYASRSMHNGWTWEQAEAHRTRKPNGPDQGRRASDQKQP
jgi:hypothetical protein